MTYDQWKCRDPNDTGFYDMPEDDGPTELDIAYQRIEALVEALKKIEYASRKDSFTENERLQSVRTVVCAALSRIASDVGSPGEQSNG